MNALVRERLAFIATYAIVATIIAVPVHLVPALAPALHGWAWLVLVAVHWKR